MVDRPQVITMRQFGRWGRFGNQCVQYAFLRLYAERWGCQLQLPPWVGTHLFGTDDPPPTVQLPKFREKSGGPLTQATPPAGDELVGHDFLGYAQYHTAYYRPDADRIRDLFTPLPAIAERMRLAAESLDGRPVIGIHLRRGDYGQLIFPIVPVEWYLGWLERNRWRWPTARLFIATEDPSLVDAFADYDPLTCETLGVELVGHPMPASHNHHVDLATGDARALDFYPDFHLLTLCDVILGPNSTFSFFAAMLSTRIKEFWRASLAARGFTRIDPWNAPPLLRERVEDFPHLEGITVESNPYWSKPPT